MSVYLTPPLSTPGNPFLTIPFYVNHLTPKTGMLKYSKCLNQYVEDEHECEDQDVDNDEHDGFNELISRWSRVGGLIEEREGEGGGRRGEEDNGYDNEDDDDDDDDDSLNDPFIANFI